MNSLNNDRESVRQFRDVNTESVVHPGASRSRRGRKQKYHDGELAHLLFLCWLARERMCAKRLVVQIPAWIEEHEQEHGAVEPLLRAKLFTISAATIDRVLKSKRDAWREGANERGDLVENSKQSVTK